MAHQKTLPEIEHLEDFRSSEDEDDQYYEDYADLSVHRVMLQDRPRMTFYRDCIRSAVGTPDTIVVDVGSGTGLLSCWAAKYGARHTLSVEASGLADLQPAIFASNGVENKVTVLHRTMERIIADGVDAFLEAHPVVREAGGVRILVSEWMGFYLFHEGMLASVLRARDFLNAVNLALGSRVSLQLLPSNASLYAAPISLLPLAEDRFVRDWQLADDLDLSVIGLLDYESTLQAASPLVEVIPPRCLLHSGKLLFTGDLHTLDLEEVEYIVSKPHFRLTASAISAVSETSGRQPCVDGFTLWFDVSFGAHTLDTSPSAPATHWKHTTVLLPEEVREAQVLSADELVADGLTVEIELRIAEARHRYYTISVGLLENESNDTA